MTACFVSRARVDPPLAVPRVHGLGRGGMPKVADKALRTSRGFRPPDAAFLLILSAWQPALRARVCGGWRREQAVFAWTNVCLRSEGG